VENEYPKYFAIVKKKQFKTKQKENRYQKIVKLIEEIKRISKSTFFIWVILKSKPVKCIAHCVKLVLIFLGRLKKNLISSPGVKGAFIVFLKTLNFIAKIYEIKQNFKLQ